MKRVQSLCTLFALLAVLLSWSAQASAEASPLYQRTIAAFPSPALEAVGGREYKFLIDPARIPASEAAPEKAFVWLWNTLVAAGSANGFVLTEKARAPFEVERSTKSYYDTPDFALRGKGYLLRLTEREKEGRPDGVWRITVKAIQPDTPQALATPLKVVGAESETAAEENLGLGANGVITGYVEKGVDFKIKAPSMNPLLLSGWASYLPELLDLGLPAATTLVEHKAYAWRVKPGTVTLEGLKPCGVTLEAWAASRDGAPYLYDVSYGYDGVNFYKTSATHANGEAFLSTVLYKALWTSLALPDAQRWGGSKVRFLLKQPL